MEDSAVIHHVVYTHSVLKGSAYEVGRQQSEWLIQYQTNVAKWLTEESPQRGSLTPQQFTEARAFFEQYCPDLNDEIQGFADGLRIPSEKVLYYATAYAPRGQCSHLVVLPGASENGHGYVGRSYEWNHTDEDLNLAATHVVGHAGHLGFSTNLFGRVDGLNEYGLCVTMSSGALLDTPIETGGCQFWVAIRALLDRCRTVDEALAVVQNMPISSYVNLILADREGQAALVEVFCSHRALKRIGPHTPEQYLVATNHYTLPAMLPYDTTRMWQSVGRYSAMESGLRSTAPHITADTIRGILAEPLPRGVCCHHYTDYLGTLWSEVFDLTAGTVEVCFGPPTHNPWRTFDLQLPVGLTRYHAHLPDRRAAPRFWQVLPPGSNSLESD